MYSMKKIFVPLIALTIVIAGGMYLSRLKSMESTRVPEKESEPVAREESIREDDIKRLIGQMLIVGFRGTSADENSYITKSVRDLNLGGIILFDYDVPSGTKGRNIVDPVQTKKLISDIVSYANTPLFVSIDAEGGLVNRLKPTYGFAEIPSHETLGKGTAEKTRATANILGQQLSALGINFNFAPVIDVNVNPENPVIGKLGRSFGTNPEKVSMHGAAFIEGLHSSGILTSVKHFPGHGSSAADSHLGMVDITHSYKEEELEPFRTLIAEGSADTVMVAHVFNKTIDENYPASLSEKFIKELLRTTLGFTGVVVSDDMNMGAIRKHYGFEEAVVRAVQAGNDILIISNNGDIYDEEYPKRAVDAIVRAVKTGEIPLSDIYASAERIRILKEKIR